MDGMVNQVVDAAVAAVKAAWPDMDVYDGAVAQGLREPCFSVKCIQPLQEQVVGKRYFRKHLICIHYFPTPGGDSWREINSVFETLFSQMELISCDGGLIRGTNFDTRIEDDVGIFMVNYDFFVHRAAEDGPGMEELKQIFEAKEEA